MFRYAMEAADDGAGAGDAEEEFHSAFSQEGWQGDPPAEEPDEAEPPASGGEAPPADAPEAAPQEEPTPQAAERPDGWSDEDWGRFQKQFPGGTTADLWKHYDNLRVKMSRGEHLEPAPAESEEEAEGPPTWTNPDYSVLGPIPQDGLSVPQQNALAALMVEDPKSAAMWAVQNNHLLSEEEFAAVQNHWHQNDYWGAKRYWDAAQEQMRAQQQEEELGPRLAAVDIQRQREGAALAEAALPAITAHIEPFKAWLEERPGLDEHLASLKDPHEIKDAVIAAFHQFYSPYRMTLDATERAAAEERERVAEEEAKKAEAEAEQANSRARTARRSAPAAPSGSDAAPDDIRAAIMAAVPGTVPGQ